MIVVLPGHHLVFMRTFGPVKLAKWDYIAGEMLTFISQYSVKSFVNGVASDFLGTAKIWFPPCNLSMAFLLQVWSMLCFQILCNL